MEFYRMRNGIGFTPQPDFPQVKENRAAGLEAWNGASMFGSHCEPPRAEPGKARNSPCIGFPAMLAYAVSLYWISRGMVKIDRMSY